jgi:hypothetical protein
VNGAAGSPCRPEWSGQWCRQVLRVGAMLFIWGVTRYILRLETLPDAVITLTNLVSRDGTVVVRYVCYGATRMWTGARSKPR